MNNESSSGNLRPENPDVLALQATLHEQAEELLKYINRQMSLELRAFVEARDVLQDVFLEAFQRRLEFKPGENSSAFRWLATIARHRILALVRMQNASKRGGKRRYRGELGGVINLLEELAVYSRTPSQSAMSHERAQAVQKSIEHLELQYRQAIHLRYIDGLSPEQIAGRLGKTKRAIHMLCYRGLSLLRLEMKSASMAF